MDIAEEDFKRSGVNNWQTMDANRMEWRSIIRAVKAGTRLQHQYDDDDDDGGGGGGEWPICQSLVLLYIMLLQYFDRVMMCNITYPYNQAL